MTMARGRCDTRRNRLTKETAIDHDVILTVLATHFPVPELNDTSIGPATAKISYFIELKRGYPNLLPHGFRGLCA